MTLILRWKQPQKALVLRWRVKDNETIYQAAMRGPEAMAAILSPTGPTGPQGIQGHGVQDDPGDFTLIFDNQLI